MKDKKTGKVKSHMWASPRRSRILLGRQLWQERINKHIHLGRCVRGWSTEKDFWWWPSHDSHCNCNWQLFPIGRHPTLYTLSSRQKRLYLQGPQPTEVDVGEALSWWLCRFNTELNNNWSSLSNLRLTQLYKLCSTFAFIS